MNDPDANVIVPEITDEYCLRFWDGLREGRLYLGRCRACTTFHFYARVRCPHCGSPETELAEAAGTGTLVSFTSVHRAPRPSIWGVPYILALVRLDEGPRLISAMACEEEECAIGMRVQVAFRALGSGDDTLWVHQFGPARPDPTPA